MLNFGQKVEEKSGDLIPKNTLLWAVINIREVKNSRETNGRYLDIELTVADNQPYARRKIWDKIADPFDTNNSEEWRTMGYGSIRRILEAVKGATPENANSYVLNQLQDLHGLMVPIIVGEEKGKDGYDDKNKAEYLSPYSSVKKIVECFNLLRSGVYEYGKEKKAPAAPGQGSMFTGTHTPPPVNAPAATGYNPPAAAAAPPAPSFLAPANPPAATPPAAPAAPNAGFSSGGAPTPQSNTGFVPPAGSQAPAPVTTAPASVAPAGTSPSNPGFAPPAAFPGQQ